MATDGKTLLAQGKCYLCLGITPVQAAKLSLLAQISTTKNAANKTDPTSLMTQAAAFRGLGDVSNYDLLELALLVQIAT